MNEEYPEKLIQIAEFIGGGLFLTLGVYYINVNKSLEEVQKERETIEEFLENCEYEIFDMWLDHGSTIIEFEKLTPA